MGEIAGADEGELTLEILDGARLSGHGVSLDRLERKTAALLAYVAFERDATRARVSGLLWPDTPASTARNNLAQAIARLKRLAGRSVVGGKDVLSLDRVRVDALELELGVQRGRGLARPLDTREPLLSGYDFSDCSELFEWLDWRRDQLRRTLLRALDLESRRLEAERDFAGAIERAEEALALDRLGEASYRRLMRLQLARGDRARALDVFADCERVLREELGTTPSADTLALAERLRHPSSSPAAAQHDDRPPSLRFDHPRFVGREKEWAEAEHALRSHRLLFVSGEPGIGKTRFLLELAHAHGRYVVIEGRPGDGNVPFSTLARGLRQLARMASPSLSSWARIELSRIVPELHEGPAPGDAERVRLFAAALELFRHALGDTRTLVLDDLQYADGASVEAFAHVLDRLHRELEPAPLVGIGYRKGELPADIADWVERQLENRVATQIELSGLDPEAVWKLADALGARVRDRIPDLANACLGNPLFVVELVRSALREATTSTRVPPRVERLLERRLERLSPAALRLARVLAILGNDLSVEVAARVMDVSPLDLDVPWAELERELVLQDRRFVHDLLAETLERSLSRALCAYLHRRAAEELVARNASPAVIARHFELGEDEAAAAPYLMRAAEQLRTLSRLEEAAQTFERAGDIFVEHGDTRRAIAAWFAVGRFMWALDRGERFQRLVTRMSQHARTEADRARALVVRAFFHEGRDEFETAAAAAEEASEIAARLEHPAPRAEALRVLFITRMRQGRAREAEQAFEQFAEMCRASGHPEAELAALWHGAELVTASDRHLEAIELFRKADAIAESSGRYRHVRTAMRGLIAHSALALGRTSDAAAALGDSEESAELPPIFRMRVELCRARIEIARGQYRSAEARLAQLIELAPDWYWESRARVVRGALWCWLGALSVGRNELMIVSDDERTDATTRVDALLGLARSADGAVSEEQRTFIAHIGSPLQRSMLLALRRDAGERELTTGLGEARALAARGHELALCLSRAELLARDGNTAGALELAEQVWAEAFADPPGFPELARAALVRARLSETAAAWSEARAVIDAAELSPERAASFRAHNPAVAAIASSHEND